MVLGQRIKLMKSISKMIRRHLITAFELSKRALRHLGRMFTEAVRFHTNEREEQTGAGTHRKKGSAQRRPFITANPAAQSA